MVRRARSFLLIVLIAAASVARGADSTAVSVKITRATPIETLASDGSVTGVSQAVVGTPYHFVSVNGAQLILQDAQGTRYQIALSSTDYSPATAASTPATNGVAQATAPDQASPVDSGLSSAPAQVQKTIASNSEGKTVNKVERTEDDGEVSYEVETTSADGAEWDMSVGPDGTLLSIDLPFAQVPAAVQAAIKAQAGSGTLEGVAKQFDDGEVSYLAGIMGGGAARDFTFGEDGTLMSAETDLNDLPLDLQTAISAQVGKGKVESVEKTVDGAETDYAVTTIDPVGQESEFTVSDAGALVSKEVRPSELAPNIQAAINAQVGSGRLDGIDETFDDGTTAYDVTMIAPDGKKHDFTISDEGILVSRQMVLAELPQAVQDTIAQTIGDGKITRIDHMDDTKRKAYDIEGQKDGKAFNFMVGPKGRFLGMDD